MTGYAPNPKSVENAAASLTSGLLARKGHAAPAVDATAHEGVDIDLQPASHAPPRRPRNHAPDDGSNNTVYTINTAESIVAEPAPRARSPHSDGAYRQRASITLDAAPGNWTVNSEAELRRRSKPVAARTERPKRSEAGVNALRATVKFRMPAPDFVRLRLASRAMKESCQTIIIDAIAAYLDANEVEVVDGVTTRQEVERLVRKRGSA